MKIKHETRLHCYNEHCMLRIISNDRFCRLVKTVTSLRDRQKNLEQISQVNDFTYIYDTIAEFNMD